MRLREHEGVKGKRDAYPFDPRLLKVDPSYNVRDLSTPEARSKLAELKEQIRHAGVRVPLEVRMQDDDVLIVSGHRRHRAVMELIAEGEEIASVLVFQEPLGTSEIERTLNLVLSNSGEPLTQLEVAHVVKRLADFGWDHGQIAQRMGWKSNSSVRQHLDLLELPAAIQADVRNGRVSATTARKCVAEVGADEAAKIIADNAAQGKKTKPRDLRGKASKPKHRKQETANGTAPDEASPVVDAPSPPLSGVSSDRVQATDGDEARVASDVDLKPHLNGFYSAVEPIAKALDLLNWDEVADDGPVTIEISGRDAKLFIQAWTRATGEA